MGIYTPEVRNGVELCVAGDTKGADLAPPLLELELRVLLVELVLQRKNEDGNRESSSLV